MKILNPLYDNAFKYLMEDNEIAKTFLSIILKTNIISLQANPQEVALTTGLFRFDYKAVIQDENGNAITVLVEVQKYSSPNPIKRFRDYLAFNYAKTEIIKTPQGEKSQTLPLVAIYIIGFDLSEFASRTIRVDNIPYDTNNEERLYVKSDFVEQLTHKIYILIAKTKGKKASSKKNSLTEQLLNLFIQKLQGEKANPVIDIEEEDYNNRITPIIKRLNQATLDSELLRKITIEQDYINDQMSKDQELEMERRQRMEAEVQVKEAKIREREERKQKEEAKIREQEERKQKEEAKQREQAAKQREQEAKLKLAKKMIKYGESIEEIMQETQLTEEEVKKIIKS